MRGQVLGSGPFTFKLFVAKNKTRSVEILSFIYDNIQILQAMGISFSITKVDMDNIGKKLAKKFEEKGISYLPALVMTDSIVKLGVNNIKKVLGGNISEYKKHTNNIGTAAEKPMGQTSLFGNSDLDDFYMNEVGRAGNKEDDEEDMNEGMTSDLFSRRMNSFSDRRKQTFTAPEHINNKIKKNLPPPKTNNKTNNKSKNKTNNKTKTQTRATNIEPEDNIEAQFLDQGGLTDNVAGEDLLDNYYTEMAMN